VEKRLQEGQSGRIVEVITSTGNAPSIQAKAEEAAMTGATAVIYHHQSAATLTVYRKARVVRNAAGA
jgi:hypothetical protein